MHYGDEKQKHGRGLTKDHGQMQARKRTNQQRHFAQGGESKAEPSNQPKTEIASLVITAEKEEQIQQDD